MKKTTLMTVLCLVAAASVTAATLKMPAASVLEPDLEGLDVPYAMPIGLYLSQETRSFVHVVKTSPFDKIKYPVGAYTAELFARNLGQVFADVEEVSGSSSSGGRIVVEIAVDHFEAVIPHPAYNPYTATVAYKLTVRDAEGEVLYSQTLTGDGQTGKGMMSGFKAKGLAAESAVRAMNDAATQALEALADAPELAEQSAE